MNVSKSYPYIKQIMPVNNMWAEFDNGEGKRFYVRVTGLAIIVTKEKIVHGEYEIDTSLRYILMDDEGDFNVYEVPQSLKRYFYSEKDPNTNGTLGCYEMPDWVSNCLWA